MQLNILLANFLREARRKGEGEKVGKNDGKQAAASASNSERKSYHTSKKTNSLEPHSPLLSNNHFPGASQHRGAQAKALTENPPFPSAPKGGARVKGLTEKLDERACLRGQTALEYFLLLSVAAVLVISVLAYAAGLKSDGEALQGNAMLAFKNFTSGPGGDGCGPPPNPGAGAFALEIDSFEPYASGQPAFFEIRVLTPNRARIPDILVSAKSQGGENVRVEPSGFAATNSSLPFTRSAQFYPASPGIFTLSAKCGDLSAERDVLVR